MTGLYDGGSLSFYCTNPVSTLTGHRMAPEVLVVSVSLWNKLSEEDQAAFKTAGAQPALYMRELWGKRVAQAQ